MSLLIVDASLYVGSIKNRPSEDDHVCAVDLLAHVPINIDENAC